MAKGKSFIASIGTAVPDYRYRQQIIADFMVGYFKLDEDAARKLSLIYQKSGIEYRHSVLPDFYANGNQPQLFISNDVNPSLTSRLEIYRKEASALSKQSISDCLSFLSKKEKKKLLPITHLITVSCTGMSAPGLDLQLMQELELPVDVCRTSVNFMGCYAGLHAFKMADSICSSDDDAVVLVVMTELCSLHFQPEFDTENIVVNSLFADGSATALFVSEKKMRSLKKRALRIKGFHSEVIHAAEKYMTWDPSEKGFLMGLDALIPKVIEEHAGSLIENALKKFDLKRSKIDHWALHPGGRKILDAAQKSIGLSAEDLGHSFRVLRDFGNMSSPSFCFVLKSLWQDGLEKNKKRHILAAGFGPGITIETALLQTVDA
jgi:alpha-pyrone synthase